VSIWTGMNTPSSIRKLFRDITSATGASPDWLWLRPAPAALPTLWAGPNQEPATPRSPSAVLKALSQVPPGSRAASPQAPWVQSLVAAIFGTGPSVIERQVMAIFRGPQIIACVGWSQPWPASSAKFWTEKVPSVQRIVRDAINLEMIRTQNEGLRWVLRRSDRAVVAARIDGQLIGATVAATDLLKAIKFGPRHHARSDAPELPPTLIQALTKEVLRQVKLSDKGTAGFERVNEGDSWLPVVGIEFFVETKPAVPLRAPALSILTPAERDILEKVLARKSNGQIASERGTKFSTAKNQVSSVLGKLGVASRRDLFAPALCSPSMAVLGGSTAVTS
jgi:DNA-binding CsgD family transcriptional regulator